jgi:MoxR-like ATPase
MQEQQVTVDGVTRALPRPFLVLATQNPIEYEGTFPLPEAQLDRFLIHLSVRYPSQVHEKMILNNLRREHPINFLDKVVESDLILSLQNEIWDVHLDDTLQDYIINIVNASREHPDLALGASPRGSLALYKTSQAKAAISGRDYVIPDDIKALVTVTLIHRLIVKPEAELRGRIAKVILNEIIENVPLDIGKLE